MTDKVKKALMGLAALAALALGGSAIAAAASGGSSQPPAQEQNEPAGAPEDGAGDTDNVQDENGSDDATESGKKGDKLVGGSEAARARAAAEAKTGGTASEVEAENEQGSAYDVKVTKPDGTEIDVRLDAQFKVVGIDTHNEGDQNGEQDEAGGQNDGDEANQATQ